MSNLTSWCVQLHVPTSSSSSQKPSQKATQLSETKVSFTIVTNGIYVGCMGYCNLDIILTTTTDASINHTQCVCHVATLSLQNTINHTCPTKICKYDETRDEYSRDGNSVLVTKRTFWYVLLAYIHNLGSLSTSFKNFHHIFVYINCHIITMTTPNPVSRKLIGYFATSLDMYIAGVDGNVNFLSKTDPNEYGYEEFYRGIGTIVMGSITYHQLMKWSSQWFYQGTWLCNSIYSSSGKHCIILSTKPSPPSSLPPDTEWRTVPSDGWRQFASYLSTDASLPKGDVWLLGGAHIFNELLDYIDVIDLIVIPVLLGTQHVDVCVC